MSQCHSCRLFYNIAKTNVFDLSRFLIPCYQYDVTQKNYGYQFKRPIYLELGFISATIFLTRTFTLLNTECVSNLQKARSLCVVD